MSEPHAGTEPATAAEPAREDPGNRRRTVAAVLLVIAILAVLACGSTLAYFTDSSDASATMNLAASKPALSLGEVWDASAGEDIKAGIVMRKEPTVTNDGAASYVRFRVRVVSLNRDGTETVVTDSSRLALIMGTLRYDPGNALDAPDTGRATLTLGTSQITQPQVNSDFTNITKSTDPAGLYTYAYNGQSEGNGGILQTGESATLFTTIAIPADYTDNQMAEIGSYRIDVWAESIPAKGLSGLDAAMAALEQAFPAEEDVQLDDTTPGGP